MSSFFIIILIYLIYNLFFKDSSTSSSGTSYDSSQKIDAQTLIVPLSAVARMGDINSVNVQFLNAYLIRKYLRHFYNNYNDTSYAITVFKRSLTWQKSTVMRRINEQIKIVSKLNKRERQKILLGMFSVCDILGGMNEIQRNFIQKFGTSIGLNVKLEYDRYMDDYREQSYTNYDGYRYNREYRENSSYQRDTQPQYDELDAAFKTLGLDKNATNEEIKAKKNKLLRKWHPDLYATQGEEAIKRATQNSQRINEAYDIIKEARNIN